MSETNQELTQQFYSRTQSTISELSGKLDLLKDGTSTSDVIEIVAAELARLRKEYADAIAYLPSYDQRQIDKQLKDVEARLESLRASSAPKSKFAFKRKAAKPASSTPTSTKASELIPSQGMSAKSVKAEIHTSGLTLSGHSNSYLTLSSLSSPWTSASDLTISDLDHCVVNLIPPTTSQSSPIGTTLTALHVRNLSDTVLILPIITGSALLHDMKNCVIILGSRQFRMHTSSHVDVYIAISSNPIIEHCSAIRFADYPAFLRRQFGDLGTTEPSNYMAVQDFSHIRATPSPNWSALPADAMVDEERLPLADRDAKDVLERLLPLRS